jgi:site-specific DNA recombinase
MEETRYRAATGRKGGLRAVLYARVSTDEQAQRGYSIPDQLRELRGYAAREGLEVVDVIVDDGYSGASPDRPGLHKIMELAEAGETDVVLALKRNGCSGAACTG